MRHPYDGERYTPPAPSVAVRLGLIDRELTIGPLPALIDTGADATLVPLRYVRQLRAPVARRANLRTHLGSTRSVTLHLLDVGIDHVRLPSIAVIADTTGDEVILGRDVLNRLILVLDGPGQTLDHRE